MSAESVPGRRPTGRPVTIAYAGVREISRSMSYRRYFKIPAPMPTGKAASRIPRISPETLVELIPNDTATTAGAEKESNRAGGHVV